MWIQHFASCDCFTCESWATSVKQSGRWSRRAEESSLSAQSCSIKMEIIPIPMDNYNVGFIGAGKMAESIARGAVRSGVLPASRIRTAVHSNPARRTAFESFGVNVLCRNQDVFPSFLVLLTIFAFTCFCFLLCWSNYILTLCFMQVVEQSDVVIFSVKPQVGIASVTHFYSLFSL